MIAGVLVGRELPGVVEGLRGMELGNGSQVNAPIAALIWLMIVFARAKKGHFTREHHVGVQTCAMYWRFVAALWPELYGLVYLF